MVSIRKDLFEEIEKSQTMSGESLLTFSKKRSNYLYVVRQLLIRIQEAK